MKIALVAPELVPAVGGIGTYSVELIKELSKNREIELHVLTPKRQGSQYDDLELERLGKIASIHFVSNARDLFLFNFWFQAKLLNVFKRLDKENNFDLVHSTNLAGVPDISLKISGCKKPGIVTAHSTIETQLQGIADSKSGFFQLQEPERFSLLLAPAIKRLQAYYLKKTRNIIAVSEFVKNRLLDSRALSAEASVSIIRNGVDTEKFSAKRGFDKTIFPWAESPGKKILFFGRFLASKGIQTLIDAAPAVLEKNIDAAFVFAGAGNAEHWKKMAVQKGIAENCIFLGQVAHQNVPFLLNASSIVVLPSFGESLPLTILEAMSCGKPVVATEVGGIPEVISNGKDGLLFAKGDSAALSAKILRLLDDGALAGRIGKNARKTVEENFTIKKMAELTLDAYKKTLER